MKYKKIGIIGGAGPSAGSLLFNKLIEIFQYKYGCTQDRHFPYIILLNFPFSDMLYGGAEDFLIKQEISDCFKFFEQNEVDIVAVSCNTLHAFLPECAPQFHFVHMIEETKKFMGDHSQQVPLVLCTTTSSQKKLHQKYFACEYVDDCLQTILDRMIADITLGADLKKISRELTDLLPERPILLGCTEFSYLHAYAPLKEKMIFDPNSIIAEKIADLYCDHSKSVKNVGGALQFESGKAGAWLC